MDTENHDKLLVEMVMRQTTYTYEETKDKLKQYNNDYMLLIKDFYGIKKKEGKNLTINQGIFKEIRDMMDNASNNFRIKQDIYQHQEKINSLKSSKSLNKITEE